MSHPLLQPESQRLRAFDLVRQHGSHLLAYATLQEGLEYTFHEQVGYVAWQRTHHGVVALGDPVCAEHARDDVLDTFLRHEPRAAFVQVGGDTAQRLGERGFRVNVMGLEYYDELARVSATDAHGQPVGRRGRRYRRALALGELERLDVFELAGSSTDAWRALREISEDWLRRHTLQSVPLRFLIRPVLHRPERDVRVFVCRNESRPIAFGVFDPLYENDRATGYFVSSLRTSAISRNHERDLIVWEAARVFALEGRVRLTWGLAPLTDLRSSPGIAASPITHAIGSLLGRYGNALYPFDGQRQYKRSVASRSAPCFFAARSAIAWREIMAVLEAVDLRPFRQFVRFGRPRRSEHAVRNIESGVDREHCRDGGFPDRLSQ